MGKEIGVGFLRRATEAATGTTAIRRAVERVLGEVEEGRARGMHEMTVAVGVNDIGVANRLDRATPLIIREIQKAGPAVLDVEVTPYASQLRIRAAGSQAESALVADKSSGPVFAALEATVPEEGRIGGKVPIEGRFTLIAVKEQNGYWSGDLCMLLTDMQVLVGQSTPAGPRIRTWERYDFVRYGYKHVPGEGHVVRCDREDGSSVVFEFEEAGQAQALATYCASG